MEKTQKDTTKKNILDLLLEKFDFVRKDIREDVGLIDDRRRTIFWKPH